MLKSLTADQRKLCEDLDWAIKEWPGVPSQLHLRKRQYKLFKTICRKKEEFPEANDDVPVDGEKFRGVLIVPLVGKDS